MRRFLLLLTVVVSGLVWAGAAGANNGKVLILDSTVSGGAASREANAATAAGEGVDVVNGVQWAAMTTAQFAAYDAIVLGDPTCATDVSPIAPAIANASTWEAAVDGNVIVIGTDPVFHSGAQPGAVRLINNGVGFSVNDVGHTGLYLDLSCYYYSSPANMPVPWMDGLSSFGSFSLRGQTAFGGGCPARSHIVASAPVLSGLTDADLSNWGCSTHESFDQFPADFNVLVINEDIAQTYTASDGTVGGPYILVRGREVHVISDITLTPASATNPVGSPHTLTATVTENGVAVVGAVVTFTVVAGPNAGLTATGVTDTNGQAFFTYTSATPGTDLIRASFTDSAGHTQSSDTVSKTWTEARDQQITAAGMTIAATEGALFSGPVAGFSDPDTAATASEYSATIDWGDGTSSAGTISGSGGSFTVSGDHTYADEGSYSVTVTIVDNDTPANTATASSTANVADAALTAGTLTLVDGVEGTSSTSASFSFTDGNATATAADFTATIDWGDGTTSTGTVAGGGGSFTVTGNHQYAEEGSYTVSVNVIDDGGSSASASGTAKVADAALTAACSMSAFSGQSFSGSVATFSDANPNASGADFSATINWGDASNSVGAVSGGPGTGPYGVSGSHTYSSTGPFTVTVTITDDGGSTATARCSVLVFGGVAGGNFVIGDRNAAVGTAVTFWGAQWWKLNGLSGGAAPAAFKGFEDSPAVAQCQATWTTDPGNSTPPPAGPLPAYMAVIVSSSISQSGSTISGNTPHIVIVKTNPGYDANPGHAGTGTVVATVC